MIVSISRRTDILCYYPELIENSVRKGFIEVANPFNPNQIKRVSLLRKDVYAFVFWTRNALPSLPFLKKLGKNGFPFYVMITFTGYPKIIEPNAPDFETAVKNFEVLSNFISKERVIWRYDPVLLSNFTDEGFHLRNFSNIAEKIHKFTRRVIVSRFDPYKFALKRIEKIEELKLFDLPEEKMVKFLSEMKRTAEKFSLEIQNCCEGDIFQKAGIKKGACIDVNLINNLFSLNLNYEKDKNQRKECLCQKSVDIGKYNTCKSKCVYCYANKGRI